ncbi:hypothetical protein DRW03_02500 [Corallococcus sp. H22C18031201]|nr:hypothetical protein DRW03_02500 [Corallococcus sp. H22C18031201]
MSVSASSSPEPYKVLSAHRSPSSWLPSVTKPRRMLVAALAVGYATQALLYQPGMWGVSFPLVVLVVLGALLWMGGREGWERARPNAWLIVPLVVVSGFVAVRASDWLTGVNVLTSAVLMMLLTHFWAAGRVARLGLMGYPRVVLNASVQPLRYPQVLLRDGVNLQGVRQHAVGLKALARGLLLAVPVLFVFGVLLESADVAFSTAVERLLSSEVLTEVVAVATARGIATVFSACVAAGILGHALRRRSLDELGEQEEAPVAPRLGLIEALTLVFTVDALFLVFAAFQVMYLFIGDATSPAPGYTYAQYARQGFSELMLVSTLTLGLVMALARWTRRESRSAELLFRGATSVMVALTLVIVASAVKRMGLYEDAFGYTQLRLYTHVFMFALGGVLGWRAVTLWWRPERFAVGAFVTALGAVLALNVINPDAFIVRHNLARVSGEELPDLDYLMGLSADAAPEVAALLSEREPEWTERFFRRYVLHPGAGPESAWREWNLARRQATFLADRVAKPAAK